MSAAPQLLDAAKLARLERLLAILQANRDAYYRAIDARRELSRRLYAWIDEYDSHRHTPEWAEYCKRHGFAPGHLALDTFA